MLGVEREEVEADQLGFARRAAEEYDAVVLLKGRHTLDRPPRRTGAGHHQRGALAGRRRRRVTCSPA